MARLVRTTKCGACGESKPVVSAALGLCAACLRQADDARLEKVLAVHEASRRAYGLPGRVPRTAGGVSCGVCGNECQMGEGEQGYCGLRVNCGGKLVTLGGTPERGLVEWYYDPLPTNCVADWVCPGGVGAGHPKFAHAPGPERGYKNLAVFYNACTFNCLFCQNWHYRERQHRSAVMTADELAAAVDEATSCICYFGGDPTAQIAHALTASEAALARAQGKILRICWETNGSVHPRFLARMADLSLRSGGCIKFDLKALDERLHLALTGVSNRRTLDNFEALAELGKSRPEPPFLVASTLLVPGYVDADEVRGIAGFIAGLDSTIPYSLLAFHPQFYMSDLPTASRAQAEACEQAALAAGLQRVRIGNRHLLT